MIQKYYQNKPRFNGVYSRDILSKKIDRAYATNLDGYTDACTHGIALCKWGIEITYF